MEPTPKSARVKADGRRGQEVDGDTNEYLNGEEQVIEAGLKAISLVTSADSRSIPKTDRARVVHAKDSI